MIKVHAVPHKFNHFIEVREIPEEYNDLKAKINEAMHYVIHDDSYIQYNGSFGFVFDLHDDSTYEWATKFKKLLPLSLIAREKCIAILMD